MSRQNKQFQTGKILSRVLAVASSFALALFLGVGTFLLAIDDATAESAKNIDSGISTTAEGDTDPAVGANGAEVKVDVTVSSMLSLAVYPVGDHSTEVDQVSLNPISGAGLDTNMLDLVVRTNVETGYQLSIKDKDSSADLVNTSDPAYTIPTLDTNTNTAGFPDNRWGYSVGSYDAENSEFYGVPTDTPAVIAQSDKLLPGDGETTTVTFGAKVNSAIPHGLYEDIVLFTASPKLVPSTYTLTIHYRYEDGSEAAADYVAELDANTEYSVPSPAIADYYPSQDVVSGVMGNEAVEVTVTYSQYHTVTVKYIYEDGTKAGDDAVRTGLKTGDNYEIPTPALTGYYPDKASVSGVVADQNIVETVTYKKYYTATVKFVNEQGTEIATAQSKTNLKTGDSYSFDLPDIPGYYTDETSPVTGTIQNGNVVRTITYKKYLTVTVNYVYENGAEAHASDVQSGMKPGDSYSFTSPTITGYYPDKTSNSGQVADKDITITVTYKKYYTATVKYQYEDGSTASPTQTKTDLKTGDSYSFTVPAITGYYADTTSPITGTIGTADFTKTVIYKKYRTMTIKYETADGTTVKASTTQTNLKTGDDYTVTSPTIEGYTANQATYTGKVPANDFTVIVLYTPKARDLTSITTMQEMTPEICAATNTPSASATATTTTSTTDSSKVVENTLRDTRDNKTYKVRKLADGHCWMVQDLNHTLSTSKALTSVDSDVPSSWTPNNNTQTTTGTTWETPSATTARSYTNGIRTYYNWYAATGGTTNASTTSGNATGSVCPKGWTLPTKDNYVTLITTTYGITNSSAGSTRLRSAPLDFAYTGYYFTSGSLSSETTSGYFWSRTVRDSSYAYGLYFNSSNVSPQGSGSRGYGRSLRCTAK